MGKIRLWTQEEDKFLKEHMGKMPYKKIGEKIGRTETSIANRVSYKRIKSHMNKDTAKKWLNEYLPKVNPNLGIIEIKNKLKISRGEAEKLYKKWRHAYVNRMM
ncbi:hypothetical protein DP125_13285 [Clostridium tetani]|uniref:hypothetical protein n=1 Tax=Clostridium tetani TaxID=1513 RepID=UPI000573289A|nr:hypothetical protein [Clostridium tetani]KHO36730.1 hypothetical protein OR62_11075 [Clostridium tetani]RXI57662.1 hypothetical protein DP125_13285 [Clostridium tetani]RXI65324.1 hypothetical protein DQN76_14650 [Clostridium tetani]